MYLKIVNEVDFHKLQSALNPLYSWATAWQLPISIDKCYVLNIGAENFRCNLEINNQALPNVLSACDLGITITSNLSATMHINGAHIHISPIIPLYLRHIILMLLVHWGDCKCYSLVIPVSTLYCICIHVLTVMFNC